LCRKRAKADFRLDTSPAHKLLYLAGLDRPLAHFDPYARRLVLSERFSRRGKKIFDT
jgi:hypothetical protein